MYERPIAEEVSFHDAFALFDPLERGEAGTSPVCKVGL
jgi:hypothetical protein